ncbi:hypothetical protein SBI_00489 [Streptomyces bingchenggensis BCW-1]|uniref:Uncharacterized protein n=1 Tax=Streptomyces bingchenggensis (strain BCW-1) TaxID=749414 RepID=D7C0B9_STRBB|nr:MULTISPECIES: hypothetical protein [Streptomyces]ADI03610.1 hypothetical protein SBI_00489 [Streptomyces bingchenggensis BCW-1]
MALSVVYAVDTGHVVGALALTGAGAPPDVAALVGRALPLRVSLGTGRIATLPLSARDLAVASVDDEPAALAVPLDFGVEVTSDGKPKPALVRLASWTDGIALTEDGLTVTVKVAVARPTPVLALVSDEQDTHVLAGEIPAQQTQAKLPVTLVKGSVHGVLVLATGWAGHLEKAAVT